MSVLDIFIRPAQATLALAATLATLAAGPALAETPVRFTLDTKLDGLSAPILIGLDRGYYKAEGLQVTVAAGTGSNEAINRVAAGTFDVGLADINELIKFRDQSPAAPVKAVFMVYNRPPYAIIARKSRGVSQPKDLEGKKLGAPAADIAFAQWKIFTQASGIDASKVIVENVGVPVREPMLAAGQIDAITGSSLASYIDLKDRGVPVDDIVVLAMADYGVDLYGSAIIVNSNFAAEKPEAVKGFLRAFLRGLKDTARNPSRAIDSVLKRNDTLKRDVELERLRMALRDNIVTSEVRTNGFGGVDFDRLEKSIGQIALAYQFKARPKGADIFDPSFLPAPVDRRPS